MAGCGDTDLRHRQSLAGGRLVVVRRTFIEVVDEAEAHGMPNSWRDLRRSHSDSMLGANGGVVVAQAAVLATGPERDLIADSGLDGLSAMGAKSPEARKPTQRDRSHMYVCACGCVWARIRTHFGPGCCGGFATRTRGLCATNLPHSAPTRVTRTQCACVVHIRRWQ